MSIKSLYYSEYWLHRFLDKIFLGYLWVIIGHVFEENLHWVSLDGEWRNLQTVGNPIWLPPGLPKCLQGPPGFIFQWNGL